MNQFTIRQTILLLTTAAIWGTAFVAQSAGMEYVEPFTMNAVRSFLGGIVLLPVIAVMNRDGGRGGRRKAGLQSGRITQNCRIKGWSGVNRTLLAGGIFCGIFLCIASNLQQIGIQYTSVGKAGFITALYIVIVPILGLFARRRVGLKEGCSVVLAVIGLYLLCMKEGLRLSKGDGLVLSCAFVFSVHILAVDYFSPKVDGVKMSCIQFFVCGMLSFAGMLFFEHPQMSQIQAAWFPIVYAGVMSCGVAYTLQIVGQRGMNPTVAALILSLESVVAAAAGFVILGQRMSAREVKGCVLMFAAIILAQLPNRKKRGMIEEMQWTEKETSHAADEDR